VAITFKIRQAEIHPTSEAAIERDHYSIIGSRGCNIETQFGTSRSLGNLPSGAKSNKGENLGKEHSSPRIGTFLHQGPNFSRFCHFTSPPDLAPRLENLLSSTTIFTLILTMSQTFAAGEQA
jgi:hypothetical protein